MHEAKLNLGGVEYVIGQTNMACVGGHGGRTAGGVLEIEGRRIGI